MNNSINNTETEFQDWLKKLDKVAVRNGYSTSSISKETGEECWRGYFDDGSSPEEALNEDASYG